jgi:hypothetical protein
MSEALVDTAEQRPRRPLGIVEHRINPESGLIADDGTSNTIFEKFDIDRLPERETRSFSAPLDAFDSASGARPASNPFLE